MAHDFRARIDAVLVRGDGVIAVNIRANEVSPPPVKRVTLSPDVLGKSFDHAVSLLTVAAVQGIEVQFITTGEDNFPLLERMALLTPNF